MRDSVSLCLGMAVVSAIGATASAQYIIGDTWNRTAQWVPGNGQGSTIHNPGPDPQGSPVWSYEYASGGGLSSTNPWFAEATTPMTWDPAWWQTGKSVWSRQDDLSPPIMSNRLIHMLSTKSADIMPIVRWSNPVGDDAIVHISGGLTIGWQGYNGSGYESTVEVVIAMVDASAGTTYPIYSSILNKPSAAPVKEFVTLPILLGGISLDQGDSILVTHRAATATLNAGWVSMYDGLTLTLSQVPAPATGMLGAIFGLALSRRRR